MRIVALDETASRLGLFRGQGLADARAMLPMIDCVSEDGIADRELLDALAGWCDRYTPLVSCDSGCSTAIGNDPEDDRDHACDGNLLLDITGCARLFGGEENLVRDLLTGLYHQGFAANAAIAPTPGGAWALARFASPAATARIATNRSDLAAMLMPLPISALRLENETVSALARVGLRKISQVFERPRAPLARRFGKMLLLRLDQALGAVEEAISPRLPAPDFSAERRLAEPVVTTTDIEQLTLRLATLLCEQMKRHGKGARLLDLTLWRVDSRVFRLGVGASRPLREPELIQRLFAERIAGLHDDLDAGFGFDMLRLSASETAIFTAEEPDFVSGDRQADTINSDLADRLAARLGEQAILRPVPRDTHLPEASEELVAAADERQVSAWRHARTSRHPALPSTIQAALPPLRPLRLFERPEPVEAVASIPDGPPLRFRWRRVLHEVARAEGPERIEDEWWHAPAMRQVRDYFRVEDGGGRRFWLFRQGLYGAQDAAPRWFIHGLFA
ncbi:MAG: DNA polymerase Y family protein [Nitratireductor sp.]